MTLDRRNFLISLPALMMTPKLVAQAPGTLKIRSFNHVSLTVRDLARSIEFYQGLFGMPIQSRHDDTDAQLRLGDGPHFLNLVAGGASATPKIDRMGVGVEDFNADRVLKVLSEHGVQKSAELAPSTAQVVTRGTGKNATTELHLGDPDGVDLQLVDPRYCGGTGPLGTVCGAVTPASKPGLIALRGYSHCTVFTSDAERSNAFYRKIFGMPYRS